MTHLRGGERRLRSGTAGGVPDRPSTIVTVNDATWGSGGGFSQVFSKPFYQDWVSTGSDIHRSYRMFHCRWAAAPEMRT